MCTHAGAFIFLYCVTLSKVQKYFKRIFNEFQMAFEIKRNKRKQKKKRKRKKTKTLCLHLFFAREAQPNFFPHTSGEVLSM